MKYRKTRKRDETPNHLRFLTFSCYHRLPFFKNDAIKNALAEQIVAAKNRTCFGLVAWVIMPEHIHVLIRPALPEHPVSEVLPVLKGEFANRVLRRWRAGCSNPHPNRRSARKASFLAGRWRLQ